MAALRDIPMAEPALAVIARLNARANPPACRQRGELAAAWPPALAPDARAPDTLWGSTPIRAGRVDRLLRHLPGRQATMTMAGAVTDSGSGLGFADAVVRLDVVSRLRLHAELECRVQEVGTQRAWVLWLPS